MSEKLPSSPDTAETLPLRQDLGKPRVASGYAPRMLELVHATCLYVATVLGDLLEENVTIVGGFVPCLLIPQDALEPPADRHIGTRDLDLGLALGVLDHERYEVIARRLRNAGFRPDLNKGHNLTRQRWRIDSATDTAVTVDFLIPPVPGGPAASAPFSLDRDFAATVTPGLDLAFVDRVAISLEGRTIRGEWARRTVWVCGPGAFVVLKALAFRGRGERKDAYDLYYVLRHYGISVADVAVRMRLLLGSPDAQRAVAFLREDFARVDAVGPTRVAAFLERMGDDAVQADARAFVLELLDQLERA